MSLWLQSNAGTEACTIPTNSATNCTTPFAIEDSNFYLEGMPATSLDLPSHGLTHQMNTTIDKPRILHPRHFNSGEKGTKDSWRRKGEPVNTAIHCCRYKGDDSAVDKTPWMDIDKQSKGANGTQGRDSAAMQAQRQTIAEVVEYIGVEEYEKCLMQQSGFNLEYVQDLCFTAVREYSAQIKRDCGYKDKKKELTAARQEVKKWSKKQQQEEAAGASSRKKKRVPRLKVVTKGAISTTDSTVTTAA
ncbi:hypothetical protein DFJ73DRAFT_766211 [Zopfochytrium polystomum]|nr:hypothetical protein DFJ73DRAFT_766211 [Zopfochytrium polystomum]